MIAQAKSHDAIAGAQYAAAHRVHYADNDLPRALDLYRTLIAAYPDSREAGYSRSQVQNIVNMVVPKDSLLAAQMRLAKDHFHDA